MSHPIQFTVKKFSLGFIVIANSINGVFAIMMGDDPDALSHQLQRRFPLVAFIRDDKILESVSSQIIRFIEKPTLTFDLPLDIRGTAFQRRVWQELQKIPVGVTRHYTDIARQIGKPSAARAVAQACAANAHAVVIPCHRVVRRDGSLSGYRWGTDRKKVLLEREK